jgi:hypothetical protein
LVTATLKVPEPVINDVTSTDVQTPAACWPELATTAPRAGALA